MRPLIRRIFQTVLACGLLGAACRPGVCQTGTAALPVLTLPDAIRLTLADNGPLNAGARGITEANDAAAATRAEALPTLNIHADAGALLDPVNVYVPTGSLGSVNDAPFPVSNARIYSAHGAIGFLQATLAQPLTQLPRIRLNTQLQQLDAQAAVEQQRGRRLAAVAQVRQLYYGILGTQDSLAAARLTLASDEELERTVADFVSHKTALQADLLDAQAQTDAQRLTLTTLQDTLDSDREQMNVALGRDMATPFSVVMPADDLGTVAPDIAALRAEALAQRPDLRAAALQVQRAALGRRIVQQASVPDVSLVLTYAQLPGGASGLPNHVAAVGLQLDWSPLDWGRQRDALDAQAQQTMQAQAALTDAQNQALLAVGTQARQLEEAQEQLVVAQAGQRAAQERLREMTDQYRQRAILLKDVMQQQAAAADADRRAQQAMLQVLSARASLETAVGDGP